MKLGVFLPVSGKAAVPEVLAEAAQQAENLGYSSVWAAERLVNPWEMNTAYPYKEDQKWQGFVAPNVPFLEPLTALSFLAGVTKKTQLGISVAVLPYRSPLFTARCYQKSSAWNQRGRIAISSSALHGARGDFD